MPLFRLSSTASPNKLPKQTLSLLQKLSHINVSQNNLSGKLTNSLKDLKYIKYINLSENNFQGSLPDRFISNEADSVFFISLKSNRLAGCIPQSWSSLCGKQVDLSNNDQMENDNWNLYCSKNTGSCLGCKIKFTKDSSLNLNVCNYQIATLSCQAQSPLPFTYRWYYNNNIVSDSVHYRGINSSNLEIQHALESDKGAYYVVAIGGCGSYTSNIINLTVNNNPNIEYNSLFNIYNSLSGTNWLNSQNWFKNCDPCSGWYGIECSDGKITKINLMSNNLNGELPNVIGEFKKLKTLDLSDNKINGYLNNTFLNTSLESVFLQNNSIKGYLPDSLLYSSKIKLIDLSNNQISGNLTIIATDSSSLESLNISNNSLNGNLPLYWDKLSNLKHLDFSNNKFTGNIPSQIGRLTNLLRLNLSQNMLNGPIPRSLAALKNLIYGRFNNNRLSGCIPDELNALCTVNINLIGNPDLPFGGNWMVFCANNSGSSRGLATLKEGNWHDRTIWSCGSVPSSQDMPAIKHAVTISPAQTAQAFWVRYEQTGKLLFGTDSKLQLGH